MVRSLGADAVVDYTREDFSRAGRIYDVVFDAVGKAGYRRTMSALKRGGTYVLVAGIGRKWFISNFVTGLLAGWWAAATGSARIVGMPKSGGLSDLLRLKLLIEAGQLRTVIERRYTLDDIVEAHRHAEGGHKTGHVLIRVERPVTPA
jgi:NADPH:quinone reductase-like Zn-dependent oxidoreductase